MNTYLNYYNETFAPKLRAIDLFIKTEKANNISVDVVSELLNISENEILSILQNFDLNDINKTTFFTIMQYGSSDICKLFSRELQRKMPYFYSFYDISYIYQIPYETVVDAANKANITKITNKNMHILFSNIVLTIH